MFFLDPKLQSKNHVCFDSSHLSCSYILLYYSFQSGLYVLNKHILSAGWEVRIVKNCDRGLENAAQGRRPKAPFSSPRSQFFTTRTNPKPVNNLFMFFQALKRKHTHETLL